MSEGVIESFVERSAWLPLAAAPVGLLGRGTGVPCAGIPFLGCLLVEESHLALIVLRVLPRRRRDLAWMKAVAGAPARHAAAET